MLNFTVGPVQLYSESLKLASKQIPYFRTDEFSKIVYESDQLIKKMIDAPRDSRTLFLTMSGSGAMEAAVVNTLSKEDKILIVNGGSFGQRFVDLCKIYDLNYTEIKLDFGLELKESDLERYEGKDYTAFLINIHETSSGVHYNSCLVKEFCQRNNLFLIVDAISSFLADPFDMSVMCADVVITASQKALAVAPGISIIVLAADAVSRVEKNDPRCLYLNLKLALKNADRGQTPFTPAVGTILQINNRLKRIEKNGGSKSEIEKIKNIADDFRKKIVDLPFEITTTSLSNAVTPIHPMKGSADSIFKKLKNDYGIWVCPSGGNLADYLLRIGHLGNLTVADNDRLIDALNDLHKKNYF